MPDLGAFFVLRGVKGKDISSKYSFFISKEESTNFQILFIHFHLETSAKIEKLPVKPLFNLPFSTKRSEDVWRNQTAFSERLLHFYMNVWCMFLYTSRHCILFVGFFKYTFLFRCSGFSKRVKDHSFQSRFTP